MFTRLKVTETVEALKAGAQIVKAKREIGWVLRNDPTRNGYPLSRDTQDHLVRHKMLVRVYEDKHTIIFELAKQA